MNFSAMLLPEFDHEMANTRKTLERVPDGKFGWKPHDKSMSLGDLASHLANLPTWTNITINQDQFDMAPPDAPAPKNTPAKTQQELLERFDKNVAAARAAIAAASDELFRQPWSFLVGGKVIFTMPRLTVLRNFVMNHNVHHRAQLGVYLRLNDIPVPAVYGPSADEA